MNIYQDILVDHYRYPRNRGRIEKADFVSEQHNPSCGDLIIFSGIIAERTIKSVRFEGAGCVISQAAGSLLTEFITGKTIDDILSLEATTMLNLIGMQLGPVRIKCALLSLQALQQGLHEYLKNGMAHAEPCQSGQSS